jgi:hypothetical protein
MSDLDTIRKQKADAEAQRQQVIDYEKQQELAEAARQQQLAKSEQDIARLRQMEGQAQWQQDLARNAELVQANHAAIASFQQQIKDMAEQVMTLLDGLSTVDIDEIYLEQQQHAYNAVAQLQDSERERLRQKQTIPSETTLHTELGYTLRQKHRSIQPALPLRLALVEKISHAKDEKTKRVLQGIAVMLTGDWIDPPKNITREALENDVRQRTIP